MNKHFISIFDMICPKFECDRTSCYNYDNHEYNHKDCINCQRCAICTQKRKCLPGKTRFSDLEFVNRLLEIVREEERVVIEWLEYYITEEEEEYAFGDEFDLLDMIGVLNFLESSIGIWENGYKDLEEDWTNEEIRRIRMFRNHASKENRSP